MGDRWGFVYRTTPTKWALDPDAVMRDAVTALATYCAENDVAPPTPDSGPRFHVAAFHCPGRARIECPPGSRLADVVELRFAWTIN